MILKRPKILFLISLSLISLGAYELDQRFNPPRGLEGRYYPNLNWQDEPRLVTLDSEISTALLRDHRKRFPENRFSVAWDGFIVIDKSGEYTFATASDDGSWLYVDGQQVVDNGGSHGLKQVKGRIDLRAGIYPIQVRYFQAGGYARMDLSWARGNRSLEKLPSYVLSPSAINYRDYKLRRGLDHALVLLKFTWLGALVYFVGLWIFYSISKFTVRHPQFEVVGVALLLMVLTVIFFYDIVFQGKTLLTTNAVPGTMKIGAYNYAGHQPLSVHVIDPAASAEIHEPITHLTSLIYKKGIIPLWNPHAATGIPLNADMISTVFFPLSFLLYLNPSAWMWDLFMLSRIFIAGFLAYLFFRKSLEFSILGALAGAIAYMFCGHLIWQINIVFMHAAMLLPGLLYFTHKLAHQGSWWNIGLTGSMIGLLILGGHPEPSFFALFYASVYYLVGSEQWTVGSGQKSFLRRTAYCLLPTIYWVGAVISGLIFSAIMVLPFLEFVEHSPLGPHDPSVKIGIEYLPRSDMLLLILPYFWGPLNQSIKDLNWQFQPGYLGVIAALLVLLTVVEKTAFTKQLIFFTGMALFFILKGYGIPPALSHFVGSLPIFKVSYFTRYFAPEFLFSTAALAGFQIYRIQQGKSPIKLLVGVSFFVIALLGFWVWFQTPEFIKPAYPLEKAFWQVILLGAVCVILGIGGLLTLKGFLYSRYLAWLGCLGLGIELFWLVPRTHYDRYEPFVAAPYINFLKNDPEVFRVYGLDGYLYPNVASAYELNDIGYVNGLVIKRFHEFSERLIDKNLSNWFFTGYSPFGGTRNLGNRALDLLNLKYVVTAPDGEDLKYHLDSFSNVYTYGLRNHGELTKGRYFGQTFKVNENHLTGVSIFFSRYLRLFGGEAIFKLKETPEDPVAIYTIPIDMAQVRETYHHLITFPPIANSKGCSFYFEVSVPEGQPNSTLTIWANERDVYPDGQPYVDGKPVSGDFGFMVYTLSSHASFDKIYEGEVKIYKNNQVLPRAFIVHQVEVLSDKEKILTRLADENFDLRNTIILEEEPVEVPGVSKVPKVPKVEKLSSDTLNTSDTLAPFSSLSTVEILQYESTRVTLKTQLERPGFLVLADPYYPGWRAYVNGQERKIYLTNYLLRSVPLETGNHLIEFRYEPTSYKVGAWLTLVGSGAFVATFGFRIKCGLKT